MTRTNILLRVNPLVIVLTLASILLIAASLAGQLHLPRLARTTGLAGQARVVDGDTIELGRTRIRLFGIDAPESAQTCERDGTVYSCGEVATHYLEDMIAGRPVICRARDTDRYGRAVATCAAGDTDINAEMVSAGWAVAYRRYSDMYVKLEQEARQRRVGIWAGQFVQPADWRRGHHGR